MHPTPTIDDDILQHMLAWRHDIHAHPETAFEEHRTSDLVASVLTGLGLPVHRGLAGTGVVATLHNGQGPRIALRADMDALHMDELGNAPHRSTVPGKMHACGHDGHTAMLLGATEYLVRHGRFQGTVQVIFQPAEENEGGGRVMVEQGLFERFPVQAVYGLHNFPEVPLGHFAVRTGSMSAFLDNFQITVAGKGTHGATPQLGIDPIVAASQLVMALQTVVSRNTPALDAAVVSVTQIHGGDTWNVIPEQVVLRGTVRTLDPLVHARTEQAIARICQGVAQALGARIDLDYRHGYPAAINTPAEAAAAATAATAVVGAHKVDTAAPPIMASEDFAFMLQAVPGAYIGMGTGRGPDTPHVHNPYYDFNDHALPLGAAYWVSLVQQQLPLEGPA
ncbi:M20 aminoacylase family protein [Pseudoxanthomonas winnipegensis]|uniref:Amidohydrolase n=1 Tax=Pseudoxanthomonas winnipegensis TaxID=2480810 RepID=A0A4Q8M1M5_9GAMM|nr:M20 aminoacylase family protein [Pseudoxanthomonas winnipegensis]TAA39616.1 amidohydrolase [Pseudoxanthomonas winnipegensis]